MEFYKYHGTGNDFIIIDNRGLDWQADCSTIAALCHRRFGIGADGLMLLDVAEGFDFSMRYFNADGGESTMCGNGGRCITALAKRLGIIDTETTFIAIDGPHKATIYPDGMVSLHMKDVHGISATGDGMMLDTGSPHIVKWVADALATDVYADGKKIRYSTPYLPDGVNVNFVTVKPDNKLYVRTYERGVEDETLSCGTGVVAASIASTFENIGIFTIEIETPGGHLSVSFTKKTPFVAEQVVLNGPAAFVFKGSLDSTFSPSF